MKRTVTHGGETRAVIIPLVPARHSRMLIEALGWYCEVRPLGNNPRQAEIVFRLRSGKHLHASILSSCSYALVGRTVTAPLRVVEIPDFDGNPIRMVCELPGVWPVSEEIVGIEVVAQGPRAPERRLANVLHILRSTRMPRKA